MSVTAAAIPAARTASGSAWGRRILNHALIFLALIAAWEAGSRLGLLDELTSPRPSAIVESVFRIYVEQGNIYWHFFVTLVEATAGFIIGASAGVGLAIMAGINEPFRRYIQPYILVPQVTPRVALTPMLIAWLGFGWSPKIAIAALICFFPPFVNTVTGMLNVDEDAREMFRSMGASKRQIFWKLQLPNAMPTIMAGLKIAMSLALAGAIVGEFLSAHQGMAVLIHRYTYSLNMASAFAVLLSLTAMGFLFFKLAEFADSRIVFWRHDDRLTRIGRKRAAAMEGVMARQGAQQPGAERPV
ncbi:MAG TPA: ABC transporter permease [Propylenella sp.]